MLGTGLLWAQAVVPILLLCVVAFWSPAHSWFFRYVCGAGGKDTGKTLAELRQGGQFHLSTAGSIDRVFLFVRLCVFTSVYTVALLLLHCSFSGCNLGHLKSRSSFPASAFLFSQSLSVASALRR